MELDKEYKAGWSFDLGEIVDHIKSEGAKVVGLQFPDGLKYLFYVAKEIGDSTGAKVIISGKSCYGACDIDSELRSYTDLLFHFGHAEIVKENKTVFVEVKSEIDVKPVIKKASETLDGKKVGVITTVQHIHALNDVREIIEGAGKEFLIKKGDSRIKYPGQILGCNFSSAKMDCDELLFLGSGDFHPIGASIASGKRVVIADPLMNEIRIADPEKIIKQRYSLIGKALDSNSFGILIGSKKGQNRSALAEELSEKAKLANKDAYIIMLNEFNPDLLMSFKVDCFVNTACPRIAIDDFTRFKKPMLTPIEFEIALGLRKWEDLFFDEILG